MLLNYFFTHNYMCLIVWYYFIDSTSIYPTTFEMVAYFIMFLLQSYVLAIIKILDKFIAEVIDAQISFTTTITIQKCEVFRNRVHKLLCLQSILRFQTITTAIFTFVLLADKDGIYWMHAIFLTYPSLSNYFLLLIQAKNFQQKV